MRKSLLVVALAGALAAGFFGGTPPSVSAQNGPPDEAPGCAEFGTHAAPVIITTPAIDAFVRGFERGGIGP